MALGFDQDHEDVDVVLDALHQVLNQACGNDDGELDSYALTAYADAIRMLAAHGRVVVLVDVGRRVTAKPLPRL